MTTLTTDSKRHIETLIRHGAAIKVPDGTSLPLTESFCEEAAGRCILGGYNAVTYDLLLPGIDDPMMIAIWRDGHIDSGSVKGVLAALDR